MININGEEVYGIIYKITNKINNHSYIGQTKNKRGFNGRYDSSGTGIERVYRYYKREQKRGRFYNNYLLNALEKYGLDAFDVCEVLDTAMSAEELDEKEIYYIDYFDSYNNGYNLTLGGERGCGENQPKGKDNPLSTPVCQLTLDGELIKIWDSFADIKRGSEYNVPNIVLACQGVNSHSYGYLWILKKDYDPNKKYCWKPSKVYRPVVLLNDHDQIIQEFVSITQASRELHINRETVRDACNKVWDKPKYKFRYKDEYIEEQRLSVKELYEEVS